MRTLAFELSRSSTPRYAEVDFRTHINARGSSKSRTKRDIATVVDGVRLVKNSKLGAGAAAYRRRLARDCREAPRRNPSFPSPGVRTSTTDSSSVIRVFSNFPLRGSGTLICGSPLRTRRSRLSSTPVYDDTKRIDCFPPNNNLRRCSFVNHSKDKRNTVKFDIKKNTDAVEQAPNNKTVA